MTQPSIDSTPREALRVLWLVDSLNRGGIDSMVLPFSEAIDRREVQLVVCGLEAGWTGPLEQRLNAAGARVMTLQARNHRDLSAFRRLVKLLREERIQLVHAHEVDAIIWGVAACRFAKVPVVATLHSLPTMKGGFHRESLREWLMMELLRWPRSTAVAISESIRAAFTQKYSLPPNRIRVIRGGVKVVTFERRNPERAIQLKQKFRLPQDARVVISVVPLRLEKGVDILLRAFQVVRRSVPYAQLLVVGEGPMMESWSRLADHLGVTDVTHWAGERDDVPALLAGADLFVLPSREEGFPAVLLEAMAAELPIVATQTGAVPEVLDSPAVGVLVPPRDPVMLAREISRLLQDERSRQSLGGAARRRVGEAFPAQTWVERLMTTYRETAGVRRGPLKIAVVEFEGKGERIHHAFQLCRSFAGEGADVTLLTGNDYELESLPFSFRIEKLFTRGEGGAAADDRFRVLLHKVLGTAGHYRDWAKLSTHLRDERYDVVQFGDVKRPSDFLPLRRIRRHAPLIAATCHSVQAISGKGRRVFERAYGLFDRIFVHFDAGRAAFQGLFGTLSNRVQVIPHGNQEIYRELQGRLMTENRIRTELGFLPDEPVVLYFGELSVARGIDVLVEAFAWVGLRQPRAQLVITGPPAPGFEAEKHLSMGRSLGVGGRVHIVSGAVAPQAVAAWMKVATVVAFPDREMDESGSILIAQTFGAPIVATNVGWNPEVIEDGVSGLLVSSDDPDALAHGIARLLEHRDLARQLGDASRAIAEDRFSWKNVAAEILRSYTQRLGRAE